jgi:hypothetical protein
MVPSPHSSISNVVIDRLPPQQTNIPIQYVALTNQPANQPRFYCTVQVNPIIFRSQEIAESQSQRDSIVLVIVKVIHPFPSILERLSCSK